jgi:hypothetical protein
MTVYVDDVAHAFGRMKMCHMWADTLDELLAMADRIGVQRKWLQRPPEILTGQHRLYAFDERYRVGMKASWVHFDIAISKKTLAIAEGAVLTDRYGPLEHEAKLCLASGHDNVIEIGRRKLAMVESARS